MRNRTRATVTLVTLALLASACSDSDKDEASPGSIATPTAASVTTSASPASTASTSGESTTTSSASPSRGCDATVAGTRINFGTYFSPGKLDPVKVAGGLIGGTEIAALYDVLFTYDYDTGKVVPHLAESIDPSDDYTSWTLTLRAGIKYSDGTPLDAKMVEANLKRYSEPGVISSLGSVLRLIESTEVIDDRTLRLNLTRPWVELPTLLADQPGMIVNTNAIADPDEFANNPPANAGVGPYVVERNAPNEEIVLVARDDYWGGPVCVERLRFVSIPGAASTYEAFRNGELDVAFLRDPAVISEARSQGNKAIWTSTDVGLQLWVNHSADRPGADKTIREAIWLALDGEAINQRVYGGYQEITSALINEKSPWWSSAVKEVQQNTDRARQLVSEAKAGGFDGQVELLINDSPSARDAAIAYQGQLDSVGFSTSVSATVQSEVTMRVLKKDFDVAVSALDIEPAQIATRFYNSFHSMANNPRSTYTSPAMDAAIDKAMAAVERDEKLAALAEVNNIYEADFVSPNLANAQQGVVLSEKVEGVVRAPSQIFLFHNASIS